MWNFLIASACETSSLAALTASWISARSTALAASSRTVVCSGTLCSAFHLPTASSSRVTRTEMNGRPSPMTTACDTSGCERMRSSIGPGETFLPPAVTMRSFLRPVTRRWPVSSSSPRSPVLNHSPSKVFSVASSFCQ